MVVRMHQSLGAELAAKQLDCPVRDHLVDVHIQENLADKARRRGIPVWRFTEGGA
jgi:hypothetical protein